MGDVVFVALIVGFFTLAVGLVKVCERVVGPDTMPDADLDARPGTEPVEVKA